MATADLDYHIKFKIIKELAEETGNEGLIAGQMVDILSEGKKVTKKTLKYIHYNKTARMINMPIRFGCYLADAEEEDLKRMNEFGEKIGLAFQIVDDVLDIEGTQATLGKSPLFIDDSPTRTVTEIGATARRLKRRQGSLGLILVDYLQLIQPDNPSDPRQEQVAKG